MKKRKLFSIFEILDAGHEGAVSRDGMLRNLARFLASRELRFGDNPPRRSRFCSLRNFDLMMLNNKKQSMASGIADVRRASRVLAVFAKHGFGYFIHDLGLRMHLPFHRRLLLNTKKPSDLPVRMRKAFEDLGATYIKLGQLLSLRPDLVPLSFADEFKKLQDRVRPFPYDEVLEVIETSLNKPVHKVFSSIDKHPAGSASVAQVHKARTKDGKDVVIKVQRPGIEQLFSADIDIMKFLARQIEKKKNAAIPATKIVKEFEGYTARELNFLTEAGQIASFYERFKDSKKIKVPQVESGLCTKRVLVMEQLDGTTFLEIPTHGVNRHLLAEHLVDFMLSQIFEHGVFHADMHPGNLLLMKDGRIGVLDFGIVGTLTAGERRAGIELFTAIHDKDYDKASTVLLKLSRKVEPTQEYDFRQDVRAILHYVGAYSRPTHLLHQLFTSASSHGLTLPSDFVLLAKALVTVEGSCLFLDPHINLKEYIRPRLEHLAMIHIRPTRKSVFAHVEKTRAWIGEVGSGVRDVLDKLSKGNIRVDVEHKDMAHLSSELDKSSNRVSYALIIAAFVLAGALTTNTGPLYMGISILSWWSFILAAVLLLAFFVSVLRESNSQ